MLTGFESVLAPWWEGDGLDVADEGYVARRAQELVADVSPTNAEELAKLANACGYSFCAIVGDPDLQRIIQSWGILTVLDQSEQCLQP